MGPSIQWQCQYDTAWYVGEGRWRAKTATDICSKFKCPPQWTKFRRSFTLHNVRSDTNVYQAHSKIKQRTVQTHLATDLRMSWYGLAKCSWSNLFTRCNSTGAFHSVSHTALSSMCRRLRKFTSKKEASLESKKLCSIACEERSLYDSSGCNTPGNRQLVVHYDSKFPTERTSQTTWNPCCGWQCWIARRQKWCDRLTVEPENRALTMPLFIEFPNINT